MLPALAIPIALYTTLALFGVNMTLPVIWVMSTEDLLVASAFILVGVEIWRSTAASPAIAKHLVASLVLLLLCILEWFAPWLPPSGTFAVLTVAAFINVVVSTFVAFALKGEANVWISDR